MADPWLADRLRAEDRLRRYEQRAIPAVREVMRVWLDTTRALILGQPLPGDALTLLASGKIRLTCPHGDPHCPCPDGLLCHYEGPDPMPSPLLAAADPPRPDIDAARAGFAVWGRGIQEHVEPVLDEAFGEAFAANLRHADLSPHPYAVDYLETVHDRLKIWPEGAFEELRPELLEALDSHESYDQIQDRVGRILTIDAPSRRIRAEISAIDRELADPDTDPAELPILRGRRSKLWNQHDASLQQWEWLARRIARTEIHAAIQAGAYGMARAVAEVTGEPTWARWLAEPDTRVRPTHRLADGQIVPLGETFTVGRGHLHHPGEAGGPAEEVIQCRCSLLFWEHDEVQAALQGPEGGRGIAPGAARLGPDDPDVVAAALEKVKAQQRGEDIEWPLIADQRPTPAAPLTPAPEPGPLEPIRLSTGRVLPEVPGEVTLEETPRPRPPRAAPRRTYDELVAADLVAPPDVPDRDFNEAERRIADWLREHGAAVRSVAPDNRRRTPDAVLPDAGVPVEFKSLGLPALNDRGDVPRLASKITAALQSAAGQAAHVVIDARESGLSLIGIVEALRGAVADRGANLAEVLVIAAVAAEIGGGPGEPVEPTAVHWKA